LATPKLVHALEAVLAAVGAAQVAALARVAGDLPDVVEQPRGGELDVVLAALALEELLELVVAVALGGHRPELADDATSWRGRAQLVDLHRLAEPWRAL
jgi:hypothetical protein